ncbi:hypothetical protein GGS26DRAFT_553476 [Hypomontagnella submonticulosa]|nr:hypothetical protein GGS26DRAFT_553476 [Hypomontagnella submonticulosa]
MSCPCRTTSLRIFVQSLTELRISESAITTVRQTQRRYPRTASFHPRFAFSRPYSAATALRFPQQISTEPALHSPPNQVSEAEQQKVSDDATVDQSSAEALDASASDLDQAKRKGAILDFSPESIDALVTNLDESPVEDVAPRNKHVEPVVRTAAPVESSRLKRLKILRDEPKRVLGTPPPPKKEEWQIQKSALKEKFPEGWSPRKRLSPDALDGIRALHSQFPEDYTTEVLAEKFEVSAEAIRRILRSKWTPSVKEEERRQERWFNRGKNIWSQMAALGKKPPRRWRREGIVRDPSWNIPKGPRTQPPRQRQPRVLEE